MSVLATDNFNRAGPALGSNWGLVTGLGDFSIAASSVAQIGAGSGNTGSRYTGVTAPANQYAKVTVTSLQATSDEGLGPAVRMASGAVTMYFAQCNTTEIRLYRVVGNSFAQLGSDAAAAANNDVIEIDANGTSITVKKNGSTIIGPITDANISTGDWGMWGSNAGGGAAINLDNWEGGDFSDFTGLFNITTPFTPTDIAGCKLWLKADSLVLSDSDPVTTWSDNSGNGNDATQGTGGVQPLYKTNIINGLPSVLFDGTDDFMSCASAVAALPVSMFVVARPTKNTASQKNYATVIGGGNNSGWIVAKIATSFWGTFTTPTGDLSSANSLSANSNYLLELTGRAVSQITTLYQRGSQVANLAERDICFTGGTTLGKDLVNANRQYAGYISEALIYDTILSSGDRVSVETYLINRYHL